MIAPTTQTSTDFHAAFVTALDHQPWSWLKSKRMAQYNRFETLGFPTTKQEEWKYTNVAPVQEALFHLPVHAGAVTADAYRQVVPDDALVLVFVDGILSRDLSRIRGADTGVALHPLSAVIDAESDLARVALDVWPGEEEDCFASLNAALTEEGAYLWIGKGTVVTKEVHMVYLFTDQAEGIMAFPRNIMDIGANSEVKIVQSFIGADPHTKYFSNVLTHLRIGANARVQFTQIQTDSLQAYQLQNTHVVQERDSHLEAFTLTVGGRITRNTLTVRQSGPGAHTAINGLYAVRDRQLVDNHTVIDHRCEHGSSQQLYKGILNGKGKTVFNGKIFVRSEGQQTNAYQLNRNLLLSPKAEANTKPQLEIYADDVKCSHGASVGPLDANELFYLLSRGIPEERAISMLSHGFVEDVLDTVRNESLRDRLRQTLSAYFLATEVV
jgi:Fe-S cluster assembly protein SufD